MIILGEIALWISLPVALWGTFLSFTGGRTGRGELVLSGERSTYAVTVLLLLASLGLIAAFVGNRYDLSYVYSYSNRELDLYFKIAGLWAGQRGSLLFWALLLSGFSSLAVFQNRAKNREFMPYVNGILLGLVGYFIIVLLFADVSPFERLGFTPANGRGLNPQLQNYWMTLHPPTLYLGFTAFAVPFAFAISALLTGRLDSRWIAITRGWILLSWFFLTNGIIFGMRWAYQELGWGGYWFWDPVENASLLPWLTATAFVHSIQLQENRGMLKIWNMGLVIVTFILTIFATFLTRSGLIESVHTFAENLKIAYIFLGFLGVMGSVSFLLVLYRLPALKSENQLQSFLSKESSFLFNNLLLVGATFAVMWGTMFPLISEGLTGQTINVGPPFYNRVNIPIGLILLGLMGIGPVIAWRRASPRNLIKNFALPGAVGLGTSLGLFLAGMRQYTALLTFTLSMFVMTVIVVEFWKGTKARARIVGEGYGPALLNLISKNRRRWGGYIVHAGVVIFFAGLAGSSFNVEVRQELIPGESMTITSPYGHEYTLVYEGLSTSMPKFGDNTNRNEERFTAFMSVHQGGEQIATMHPERRWYPVMQEGSTEVGIRSTFIEDLYVILGAVETGGSEMAIFDVKVKPLVAWIWYGGMVVSIGALVGLWPGGPVPSRSRRDRTKKESSGPVGTAAT